MLFNSFHFLFLFFPVVTGLYYALPHRFRWPVLLAASAYFYMVLIPVYILVLAALILVDYSAGRVMEGAQGRTRRNWLVLSLAANIGILGYFKYVNFFWDSASSIMALCGLSHPDWHLHVLLPIGLSFHTFQSMSYTIEVYRGNVKAERHLGIYALYVLFYPQLVAGPIERPQNLLYQFHEEKVFNASQVSAGLRLMLRGLFKKVVMADRLALLVDPVYNHPHNYQAPAFLLATIFFAFQIYCDFSGYTDIARGLLKSLGINLMTNFARPYLAVSISDFWRRWHISLSTWFRDYLYIPLGGNRGTLAKWCLNVMITFTVSGLWHGAHWTYVLWGALNGAYLIGERLAHGRLPASWESFFETPAGRVCSTVRTFALVCVAWVFFRANNVSDAFYILSTMPRALLPSLYHSEAWFTASSLSGLPTPSHFDLLFAGLAILLMLVVQWMEEKRTLESILGGWSVVARWSLYYSTIISIVFLGAYDARQFIYFQF